MVESVVGSLPVVEDVVVLGFVPAPTAEGCTSVCPPTADEEWFDVRVPVEDAGVLPVPTTEGCTPEWLPT
jgi:hypothetical protein